MKKIFLLFIITLFIQILKAQVEIEVSVDKANVLTCENMKYTLKYRCASITTNCDNVIMTASAPSGMVFPNQVVGLTTDIQSYSFSSDRRSITFIFKNPLLAGNTGIIELTGQGECGMPEGTIATLTGSIQSGSNPPVTQSVSTTLHSSNKFCPGKSKGVGLALDNSTYYNIRLGFAGNGYQTNGIGTTDVLNVTMIDNLPPNTIINGVTLTGNDGYSNITFPPNTCIIDNTPSAPKVTCTFPSNSFEVNYTGSTPFSDVKIDVTYPDASFNANDNVTNSVTVNYTPLGGSPITATNGTTVNFNDGISYGNTTSKSCTANLDVTDKLSAPNPILLIRKTESASSIRPGDVVKYKIDISNTGNVTLNDVVIEDIIPNELEVISIGDYTSLPGMLGTETRTLMIKTVSNPTYTTVTLPYTATSGDYVTAIKSTISSIPAGGQLLYMAVNVKLKPNITSGTITNCLTGSSSTSGTTINSSAACVTLSVAELDNFSTISIDKILTSAPNNQYTSFYGAPQKVGTTVWSTLYFQNKSGGQPLQNPIVADLLPIGLDYDGVIQYGASSCNFPNADNTEIIPNYQGTGRTLVRFTWNTPLPSGCDLWVSIKTKISILAPGGTANDTEVSNAYNTISSGVKNSAFLTGSSPQKCFRKSIYDPMSYFEAPDLLDIDNDGLTTTDTICRAYYYLNITSTAQLTSVKWVKGECDTVYTKYPDHGKTMPGGLANYKLIVTNNGNVAATQFEILDILPFVGDGGVIDLNARLTQWRPNLVTPVYAPSGVTIYYSTAQNPCRTDYVASGPAGCTAPNWTTILPQDPTTIQSLKFDFGDIILNPGDQLELTWDMRAPVNYNTVGDIAWNSFAYKAIRNDNNDPFLPAEPFKVGIELKANQPGNFGNFVWCDTNNNGIQDLNENGVDGVRVELYKDNGDGQRNVGNDELVSFTSTANGGLYLFPNLPIGDYYAVFYMQPGMTLSAADQTTDDKDSDGTAFTINGFRTAITPITSITSGETDLTWDQGVGCNVKAALGNYVWFDENQNNIQDEPSANGINGIEVILYNSSNVELARDTTANDMYGRPGYYLFDLLNPGDYYVQFVLTNGKTFTPNTGTVGGSISDETDSDADNTSGKTAVTNLTAGEVDLTWDAGIIIPTGLYKLGNFVWEDVNNNGVWDAGEVGFNNVVVNLYNDYNNDGIPQSTEFVSTTTTVTEAGLNGIYHFDRLPEGNYIVQIPPQNFTGVLSGYSTSTGNDPAPDPDNNVENDDNGSYSTGYGVISQPVTLGGVAEPLEGGYSNQTVDFGFYKAPICTSIVTATPGTCNSSNNQYTVTGSVTFTNPPSTGSLTVQIAGGGSQMFTAPFTSPQSYSISGQTSDGASHTVTATFSADGTCTSNTTYTAPTSCSCNNTPYILCPGESYTLTAEAGYQNYQWYTVSGTTETPIAGAMSQTYVVTATGTYIWRAENNISCPVSACCKYEFVPLNCIVCSISNLGIIVGNCDNKGTLTNANDDEYTFTLNPIGTDLGTTYTVSGLPNSPITGTYGSPTTFGPYLISGGTLNITVVDNSDSNCKLTGSVTPPPSCSQCTVSAPVISVTDNVCPSRTGTINVVQGCGTGTFLQYSINNGQSWTTTKPLYSTTAMTIIARCVNSSDTTCKSPETTVQTNPKKCPPGGGNECSLIANATVNPCNNNGTDDVSTDDYYTIQISASVSFGGSSNKYEVVIGADPSTGLGGNVLNSGGTTYGSPAIVGNTKIFKADGLTSYQLVVRDINNNNCFQIINLDPVASCSIAPPKSPCYPVPCVPIGTIKN